MMIRSVWICCKANPFSIEQLRYISCSKTVDWNGEGKNEMNHIGKRMTACFLAVIIGAGLFVGKLDTEAAQQPVVVMIDPGHGGANLGAELGTMQEKTLTLITALTLKAELEKFEGIRVYLTRDSDIDLSLKERAQAAKAVHADYLISLHYNMSAQHLFYGSEVWVPSLGENYAKGYALGSLVLDELDTYGLFRRGVKTKLNARGTDYYGVLRESTALGIPSILIEHCHLDHQEDKDYYNAVEKLQAFGASDAKAIAKYFGLKSPITGDDYSNYPKLSVEAPAAAKAQDTTPPEIATVEIVSQTEHKLSVKITAQDSDSGILYYRCSFDNGASWFPLQSVPKGTTSITTDIKKPVLQVEQAVKVQVYNGYDGMTESEPAWY